MLRSLILLLAAVFSASAAIPCDTVFGKMLYIEDGPYQCDTMGWEDLAEAYGYETAVACPAHDLEKLESTGRRVYALDDLSAISCGILNDLDCDLVFLSQILQFPDGYIRVRNQGDNKKRSYYTNCFWEELEAYEIRKPTAKEEDYRLTLRLSGGGSCVFEGKECVHVSAADVVSAKGARRIDFRNDYVFENMKRRIWSAYLIVKEPLTPAKIQRRIEGAMDELNLDMSYKPPRIREVKALR